MGEGNQCDAVVEQPVQSVHRAGVGHRVHLPPPELEAEASEVFPGPDVGLVSGLGNHDRASRAQGLGVAVAEHPQQGRGRGPEDHLAVAAVHQQANEIVGVIDDLGGLLRQSITGAELDIGRGHIVVDPIGDDLRNLRTAGVFEKDRVFRQRRELRPDLRSFDLRYSRFHGCPPSPERAPRGLAAVADDYGRIGFPGRVFSEFTVNRSILTPYNSTEGAAWKNYRTWSPRILPSTR